MSTIHYFQRYSQKENMVTNNTMLLFSRLYHHSTNQFNQFLKTFNRFVGENIHIQQIKGRLNYYEAFVNMEKINVPSGV